MPELMERSTTDIHRRVVQEHLAPAQPTTYCPVLLALDVTHPPKRSSATYILAVGLHLLLLAALMMQIHRAVHPVVANYAVHAITLTAPSAPPAPVAEKIAPKPMPQLEKLHKQVLHIHTDLTPAPQSVGIPPIVQTASPLPSLLNVATPQITVAGPPGRSDPSGQDRKSSTAQNASESAAPPSRPAPEGALSGGKATWEGEVLARLGQFRRYPVASRLRHEEGVVYIRFRLDRSGHVLSSQLEHSSGFTALDKEAIATVARAQPLPAIPANMPDTVELSLPIEFFLR